MPATGAWNLNMNGFDADATEEPRIMQRLWDLIQEFKEEGLSVSTAQFVGMRGTHNLLTEQPAEWQGDRAAGTG